MNYSQKKIHKNWIYIGIVLVIGFLLLIVYIYEAGIRHTLQQGQQFSEFYYQENIERVKAEVETRLDEIENKRLNIIDYHLQSIEHEITHLGYILESLEELDIEDEEVKQKKAIEVFAEMTEFDDEHLYFVLSSNGELLVSGTDDTIIGIDTSNFEDENGVFYGREMLKAIDHPNGVYVTYSWPKEKGGLALEKTSFCLYLEEFDLIIGTGVYLEDIQVELKQTIYEDLQTYYENRDNYIFVTSYEGIGLVTISRDTIGNDFSDYVTTGGVEVQKRFMEVINSTGSGYITYDYNETNTGIVSTKVSYIADIEGWDAFIGMGFYNKDISLETESYIKEFKKSQYIEMLAVIVIFILITSGIFLLIKRGLNLMKEYMKQEEGLFTQLLHRINEGVVITDNRKEILYKNNMADKYFGDKLVPFFIGEDTDIEYVENAIIKLENSNEGTYFLELNVEDMIYHGEESHIHLVKNITTQYIRSNKFQKMSFIDELTKLPNRRALINDFEEITGNIDINKQYVIGMIDIDFFKNINDIKGHEIGDEILELLAAVFVQRIRVNDKIYRYGGEEFIILLSDISVDSAVKLVEDINRDYSLAVLNKYNDISTFSGGLVGFNNNDPNRSLKTLISESDRLMYKAKENGRNRIESN